MASKKGNNKSKTALPGVSSVPRKRHQQVKRGLAPVMSQALDEFAEAISKLNSPDDVKQSLIDFLTASELRDLQARWLIFKMLAEGVTQREISKSLGVSLCKITRGSRFLKSPRTIVRKMLATVAQEQSKQ